MEPDPRFPNRPTHPDFAKLSEAVIANDAVVDHADTDDVNVFERYARQYVDLGSLIYMAEQRTRRAALHPDSSGSDLAYGAWIDGFMAAARMFAPPAVEDGRHR